MSLVSLAMGNRIPLWFWLLFVSALVALPFPVLLPLELPLLLERSLLIPQIVCIIILEVQHRLNTHPLALPETEYFPVLNKLPLLLFPLPLLPFPLLTLAKSPNLNLYCIPYASNTFPHAPIIIVFELRSTACVPTGIKG